LTFVPKVDTDFTGSLVARGIKGIFYYPAQEEKGIVRDPVKQATELLKKVLGSQ